MRDKEEAFDEWIRALQEDVIQDEYGYEPGEFAVYPSLWRPAYDAGRTPREAFELALKAYDEERRK